MFWGNFHQSGIDYCENIILQLPENAQFLNVLFNEINLEYNNLQFTKLSVV